MGSVQSQEGLYPSQIRDIERYNQRHNFACFHKAVDQFPITKHECQKKTCTTCKKPFGPFRPRKHCHSCNWAYCGDKDCAARDGSEHFKCYNCGVNPTAWRAKLNKFEKNTEDFFINQSAF